MTDIELALTIVSIGLLLLKFTESRPHVESYPELGYELHRLPGRGWVVVTDQVKYDAHVFREWNELVRLAKR